MRSSSSQFPPIFRRILARSTLGVLAVGGVLGLAAPARADGQIWALASVTRTFAVDWRATLDFAPRWERDASEYSRSVLRVQIARAFGPKLLVGVGYEFTEPASIIVRQEQRVWQQVQVQQRLGHWTLSHRGRLEERWLRLAPSSVVRARYQVRAAHPIARSQVWWWQMFDELFYIARGTRLGPTQGFDRQRLGGGVSRALSEHVTVEVGVAWQYINRPRPLSDQNDHYALFNLLARY